MTVQKLIGFAIAIVCAIGASTISFAGSAALVPVLTGLASPVLVTNARDGSHRLFVVERGGVIKVLQPGGNATSVFLDITSKVQSGGERGLLGLTFHPRYGSNRRFFVHYTRREDGATVIAEYRADPGNPNVADLTETALLVIAQPFANHNGGMVEFGPDGFLYIGMGDGGSGDDPGRRAQDINQLLGKILRIDVDQASGEQAYSSPPSNPFFGSIPGADEIYAWGLRNPWRFSFDRGTGDLYAGDVGQNAVEEIDIIARGGNYGWRIWEGARCTENEPGLCTRYGFVLPVAEYGHTGGRCSVTGGYVYRGARSSLPAGAYVYGDFCSGEIFVLQNGTSSVALDTELGIASFGEDESGELYVVGLAGTIHRIANACMDPRDAACPPLALMASVNQPAFAARQQFSAIAGLANPGLPGQADFYLGALFPDATTIAIVTGAGDIVAGNIGELATIPPFAAGVSLASAFSVSAPERFSYMWTGNEPRGTYVFFLLATRVDALADGMLSDEEILGIATASFSFM